MNCGDCFRLKGMALDKSDQFRDVLPGEVSFQIVQDIARAESFVFHASAGFDCNQFFLPVRIAHAERRRDCRPANKRADLEDLSGANFRKMIDEDQHVQMQHGMFVTNFEKRRMNRLLPVLHQRAHQAKRIVKLIATPDACVGDSAVASWRAGQCRPITMRSRSTLSSRAIAGSSPQRWNPSRSNNFRLGSLCPKIRPTMAVIPSDGARLIASSNKRRAMPRRRNFSST